MKKLILMILFVIASQVDAAPNFQRVYELLDVKYSVQRTVKISKEESMSGKVFAVNALYRSRNDTIYLKRQGLFTSDKAYLMTTLHELVHWAARRVHRNVYDEYMEEQVAVLVAQRISTEIYGGEFKTSLKTAKKYLKRHPVARALTDLEVVIIAVDAADSYQYLVREIKRLDINNELGIQ